ncbi:MAG: hypothetical protein KAX84_18125 [Burkholderiales bacterium]|nr:hypothetical protein [Burkholderiales bacterium]
MSRKPDWRAVTYEALADLAGLMRVFAAMGFKHHLGTVPRGSIRWWQPDYMNAPGNSPHRRCYASVNRAMRDADVHLLSLDRTVFAVCSYQGEWRTAGGAQRGDDLASLGALRWSCRYGQAAAKIASLIGIRIPQVASISPAAVFAEVYARLDAAARAEKVA